MTLEQSETPGSDPGPEGVRAPAETPVAGPKLFGLTLGAALVAGLAAWLVSEATHKAFRPEMNVVEATSGPTTEIPVPESERRTEAANAALVYGVLAALVGLAMGGAGGLARGSKKSAVRAAAVGAVVGAIATSGLAAAVVPRHLDYLDQLDPSNSNLIMPMLLHGALWLGVGLAGGLGLGMAIGGRSSVGNGVIGGLMGAAIGAGVFQVVAAIAVPGANSDVPLSEDRMVRLIACLALALSVAMLSVATLSSGKRPKKAKLEG